MVDVGIEPTTFSSYQHLFAVEVFMELAVRFERTWVSRRLTKPLHSATMRCQQVIFLNYINSIQLFYNKIKSDDNMAKSDLIES